MQENLGTAPIRLVDLRTARQYLDCSRSTLRRLIRAGTLPTVALAVRSRRPLVRIAITDLEALIQRSRS